MSSQKTSPLRVYQYPNCSTCKNALKFLKEAKVPFDSVHIVDQPPSVAELQQVLTALKSEGGSLKNLFNTSGAVYKEMQLSTKLSDYSEAEALALLAENGKLIKRPFVVSKKFSAVGFKAEVWKDKI